MTKSDERNEFQTALERTILNLQNAGCKVAIFKQVPSFECDVPKSLFLYETFGWDFLKAGLSKNKNLYDRNVLTATGYLDSLANRFPELQIIDPLPLLTDSNGAILADDGSAPLYRDQGHLSIHGSMRLKETFTELLRRDALSYR